MTIQIKDLGEGSFTIVGGRDDDFKLSYGRVSDGRKIAIITTGGHPQIPNSGQCIVCNVKECKIKADAKKWFREQLVTRPWETRQ